VSSGVSALANKDTSELMTSPCVGVCTLGPGDICIGCLRTSSEIGNWSNFSIHERNRVMAELPKRLEALFAK
jgi:predicted Fe-S protein YdhL (DUF1289 family)